MPSKSACHASANIMFRFSISGHGEEVDTSMRYDTYLYLCTREGSGGGAATLQRVPVSTKQEEEVWMEASMAYSSTAV